MPIGQYSTTWVDQKILDKLRIQQPKGLKTFHAETKNVSFKYPKDWVEGINIWDQSDGFPGVYELGYVSGDWETAPGSPMGDFFFLGDAPIDTKPDGKNKLAKIRLMEQVKISGLSQDVYYCETISNPSYDTSKFVSSFGLVSVNPILRMKLIDYLAVHPTSDNWAVYNPDKPKNILVQFGSHTFGVCDFEGSKAFTSLQESLDFFKTKPYKQAKDIILSLKFGDLSKHKYFQE